MITHMILEETEQIEVFPGGDSSLMEGSLVEMLVTSLNEMETVVQLIMILKMMIIPPILKSFQMIMMKVLLQEIYKNHQES